MKALRDDVVQIGALTLRFVVDETKSRGSTVAFEFIVPEDAKVPAPHYHESADEIVFGLEGTLTTRVNDDVHEVRSGDSVFIPRGSVHHHENLHSGTARVLISMSPGTIGKAYFEEMAALLQRPAKPEPDKVREIMLRHGLVPA